MARSNVSWKGLKAFEVMIDVLPDRIAGKRLRSAYKYALKPVRDDMRDNMPVKSRALWYSTDVSIYGTRHIDQMYAVVGPRRKKGVWNMQGWHAHMIEQGTKPHEITAGAGKMMPIFTSAGFTGRFAKTIQHKGSRAFKPFSKAVDANWNKTAGRITDKVSEIMRDEIKMIWRRYGSVATRPRANRTPALTGDFFTDYKNVRMR